MPQLGLGASSDKRAWSHGFKKAERISDFAGAGLARAATVLLVEIRDWLDRPGSGRIYGSHQASAPGEPPAPNTYKLRRSAKILYPKPQQPRVQVGGRTAPYAAVLEKGSRSRNLLPRPYMRPALKAAMGKMNREIVRFLKVTASAGL